ncbi:hypothetical protein OHB26_27835 [Nocardia sp. NBC_01503]|uniref:hypothetical protein n=1 Tax=Nocardia sp. NBC_01503 TaxID=2975997 RepID=UPI002E7B2521|nr:hypothetical protein [Nocardia sp. NBC_01503]WTL30721.1 hypothetical protein OHB26_27835 [Nocardia sp. NBC_01503]
MADQPKEDMVTPPPRRARAVRSHAGEGIEDAKNLPGMVMIALAMVSTGLALTAAGYGFAERAMVSGIVAAVLYLAGGVWLAVEYRRTHDRRGPRRRQGH